jgi:hypothetical protein
MTVKKIFDKWANKIADPITRTYGFYKDYVIDMKIQVQDTMEKTCYIVTLHECYPKTISNVQMDYSSKDVMKLQVTMQYKYWTSDVVKTLPNDQIVDAQMLNSYTNQFDQFQQQLKGQTLGDVKNVFTGQVADYKKNWVSDNVPGLINFG